MVARSSVKWGRVAIFVALAFGLSWAVWFATAELELPWWLTLFAAWGPGVSALLLRGPLLREGFGDSGIARLGSGAGARGAYVVALFVMLGAAAASTLTGFTIGAFELGWDPMRAATSPDVVVAWTAAHAGLPGLVASLFLVPVVPLFALGEEIGWRDYLVLRLLPLGKVPALLVSGAIWALWHLPYNVLFGVNDGWHGFPLFAAETVLFGALLGGLRLWSRSVWPCAILHAAYNYQPTAVVALTGVTVGFSSAAPEQSMAVFVYATTMLAGGVALFLAASQSRQVDPVKV